KRGDRGGMPPTTTCTPDVDCPLQNDPFVLTLVGNSCWNTKINLASGKWAAVSSSASGGDTVVAGMRATDGIIDGTQVFETLGTDNIPHNSMPSPQWTPMNRTLQNSSGTLAVNGASIFGIDTYGPGGVGVVNKFNLSTLTWSSTSGSRREISITPWNDLFGI